MIKKISVLILVLLLVSSVLSAGYNEPITGDIFDKFTEAQHIEFQNYLRTIFPENDGYIIIGPVDIREQDSNDDIAFNSIRIICQSDLISSAEKMISSADAISNVHAVTCNYPGIIMEVTWQDHSIPLQISIVNQNRILFWANRIDDKHRLIYYQKKLTEYLNEIDNGFYDAVPPKAVDFNLPEEYDFYALPPDYVIQGYDNFMNYLHAHDEIKTNFASGITAFIPTDSLIEAMINNAPQTAFPNKEAPMFQKELKKFFERGGNFNIMHTLTKEGFDTLTSGEYFFAVSLNGNIRFGKEMTRTEVKKIETETGRKLPRANHAFLFPGEPVLTAGAFFIEQDKDGKPEIIKVNAQSGHYFYSNVNETIKDDIAVRSNQYLMTLGHFFKTLKNLNLPYKKILISKM